MTQQPFVPLVPVASLFQPARFAFLVMLYLCRQTAHLWICREQFGSILEETG